VIVGNPAMITAFKAGVPGNGQPFPDGSKIVKLQWKPKRSTEAPFVVDVPDVFSQAFVMKRHQEISENRRMGVTRCSTTMPLRQVHGRSQKPVRLRKRVPYSRKAKDYISTRTRSADARLPDLGYPARRAYP